ncbi:DUF1513 domain-containing protein [Veronia pacifica]|uniref:DUF1513 domain-containing protein n=1 Tax=Veronia pacifica TaxID=1080227 RepID=A0A1C3EE43_9GAMM|nr:DUF1513 domain-containing protein [Veronia pacifica]ODA31464.1 hypothetical protein A8L45_16910 [Veronia pacifica]
MSDIQLTRRQLMKSSLAAMSLAPGISLLSGCEMTEASDTLFLGSAREPSGRYCICAADENGHQVYSMPLPARGHGIAVDKKGDLGFVFARRPGEYIQVFNWRTGDPKELYTADTDRYFYGHGAVASDGLLYATEGEANTSKGVIGIYQPDNNGAIKKVGEFTDFGIGPHEVVLVDDSTLAVAVGGVHTYGREPLNTETMKPALILMDRHSGEVRESHSLPDHHLSIRHLAAGPHGEIVTGQQYRGDSVNSVPMVAIYRPGQGYQQLVAEPEQWDRFNHYIASIACTEKYIYATSPRGNCFGIWSLESGKLIALKPLLDASGAVQIKETVALSSGSGKIVSISPGNATEYKASDVLWDNHWTVMNLI